MLQRFAAAEHRLVCGTPATSHNRLGRTMREEPKLRPPGVGWAADSVTNLIGIKRCVSIFVARPATVVLTGPAAAAEDSVYFGVEGGVLFPKSSNGVFTSVSPECQSPAAGTPAALRTYREASALHLLREYHRRFQRALQARL